MLKQSKYNNDEAGEGLNELSLNENNLENYISEIDRTLIKVMQYKAKKQSFKNPVL